MRIRSSEHNANYTNHMRMLRIDTKSLIAVAFLGAGLLVGFSILAQAQGPEPTEDEIAASGIIFPVAELGGCTDKSACKAYCEQPGNMPACIEFAEKHGLMSKEEAKFARKFKDKLDVGGPGGCKSPRECEAYCSNVDRMEECMAFAEEHGIDDENIKEGRKVLAHIRSGGKMPGGCTGKDSCESYCSNVDHMEECLQFMEKSGLGPPEKDMSIGQMRTVMGLMQRGESPGGCKSKNECESYCNKPGNFEACIAFAEKAGFMKPGEAEMARKTGGVGPGGCRSPRDCEAYCNTPENQESCFQFAKERGLLREEDLERMKQGVVQLRAGLSQAPPEVVECLKSTLGPNIIEDIEAGRLMPGRAIGEKMRGCFENFHGAGEGGVQGILNNAPPEVLSCLKEKFGDKFEDVISGKTMPTLDMGDTFRVCFESVRFEQSGFGGFGGGGHGGGPMGGGQMGGPGMPHRGLGDFLKNAPPGIASCLKDKLGGEFEKAQSGEFRPTPEFEQTIRSCFESFRPQHEGFDGSMQGGMQGGMEGGFQGGMQGGTQSGTRGGFSGESFPSHILSCAQKILGEGFLEQLKSGQLSREKFIEAVKSCFVESGTLPSGGGTPTPIKSGVICPMMPTVDQCPAGQIKVEAFSSPECGTYYTCKPADGGTTTESPTYQTTEDPATRCAKDGGTWDSAAHYCKYPPTSGTSEPTYSPPPGGNLLDAFRPLFFFLK